MKYKRILVIPDLHIPYHHKQSLEFLDAVNELYKPDKVVCLGDEVDWHTISFHDNDPDLPFSPSKELETSIDYLKDFYLVFPRVDVIESNHGSLYYRKGKHHGLPRKLFRSYREVMEAPKNWKWYFDLVLNTPLDKVYFHHGHKKNVLANSKDRAMNYVQGHHHSTMDIQYWGNSDRIFWGMTAGCLIDDKEYAFNYNKSSIPRPMLGCAMINDGVPELIPMILNKKKRWSGKL